MKLICTKKETGKRVLVDTAQEPNYKNEFNDEHGNPFCEKACEKPKAKEVKAPPVAFVCEECDKEYKTESSLKAHNTKNH